MVTSIFLLLFNLNQIRLLKLILLIHYYIVTFSLFFDVVRWIQAPFIELVIPSCYTFNIFLLVTAIEIYLHLILLAFKGLTIALRR